MEPVFELHYPTLTAAAPVTRAQVSALKAQIAQSWARGKEYRLATGQMLLQLRDMLSKKGHGKYCEALVELGIKRSTACDYTRFYRESQGWVSPNPKKSRTSGNRTFKDLHGVKDSVGEYLRTWPEDCAAFWQWLADNHPLPPEK